MTATPPPCHSFCSFTRHTGSSEYQLMPVNAILSSPKAIDSLENRVISPRPPPQLTRLCLAKVSPSW